jgi:hypothetical protein
VAIVHDPADRAALVERARRLGTSSERRWGRMRVDQMMWHVNAQLEAALGRRPCAPIDNWFKRTLLKQVALHGPWPKGKAPTAREMVATGSYDLAAEQDRFAGLLDEFSRRDLSGDWARHPAFGDLTGPEWTRLAWRHADHHLSQFSV